MKRNALLGLALFSLLAGCATDRSEDKIAATTLKRSFVVEKVVDPHPNQPPRQASVVGEMITLLDAVLVVFNGAHEPQTATLAQTTLPPGPSQSLPSP